MPGGKWLLTQPRCGARIRFRAHFLGALALARESGKAGKRDRPFPAGNGRGGEISGHIGNHASGEHPWEEILAEMRGKR